MTENVKKLYELASADGALAKRLTEAQDRETVAAIAAETGIELTDADFEAIEAERKRAILAQGSEKLSDDELDAVAGGGSCQCYLNGFGAQSAEYEKTKDNGATEHVQDDPCICPVIGFGYTSHGGYYMRGNTPVWITDDVERCRCGGYGNGSVGV